MSLGFLRLPLFRSFINQGRSGLVLKRGTESSICLLYDPRNGQKTIVRRHIIKACAAATSIRLGADYAQLTSAAKSI
jgi:hypothetical protein